MSEPTRAEAVPSPEALQAWVETLHRDGAGPVDAARFRFLQALSSRIAGQPDPVQRLLQARLHAGLVDYAERVATARATGEDAAIPMRRVATNAVAGTSALARLTQSAHAARATLDATEGDAGEPGELASVRRFRRTWTSLRIQDRVDAAVARKPANAGPLNSHVLVLQSLDLMRELSPQYLERFLAHIEALQWLEQAGQKAAEPQGKGGKAVRRKK